MTITREWLEDYRDSLSPFPEINELIDLALIGLAVRDKEPGLVKALVEITICNEAHLVGNNLVYAALSAITEYRSE